MFFVINAREWPSPDVADLIWQRLWELRDVASVVVPTVVSSPCSLLAEEHADTVCLSTGMQVPQSSAWISRPIDLARFVDRNGDIRIAALERALDWDRTAVPGASTTTSGHPATQQVVDAMVGRPPSAPLGGAFRLQRRTGEGQNR